MKYLLLLRAALERSKLRTALTFVAVLAAFLLFGLLESVRGAFAEGENIAGFGRLVTVSKAGFMGSLPRKLLRRIAAVPGVTRVSYESWFGGVYRDAKRFFPSEAVPDSLFDLYPEWHLTASERRAFHDTRTGAIVGEALARKFNWKVGDRIPLLATRFPQKDGSNIWTFDLVGIYHVTDTSLTSRENQLLFRWDYLDQARQSGSDSVGWYVVEVADPTQADRVARQIDALSANSDHATRTRSEQGFDAAFFRRLGALVPFFGALMGTVFFTLMMLVSNTMAQAVRERQGELAILRALGFSNSSILRLVLAQSVLLLLVGGASGLLVASIVVIAVRSTAEMGVPMLPLGKFVWLWGTELAILIGLIVGVWPALRSVRLRSINSLASR
jgi:putative ABC transport system permease protein